MKLLLALAALCLSASAQAARPNTQDMTAEEAKNLVANTGAIVLSTSSFGYDRFVALPTMCPSGLRAVAAYVPTLDSDAAFIGYTCLNRSQSESVNNKRYARNPTLCKEGSTRVFSDRRAEGGAQGSDLRICNNGKWLRAYGADPVGPK